MRKGINQSLLIKYHMLILKAGVGEQTFWREEEEGGGQQSFKRETPGGNTGMTSQQRNVRWGLIDYRITWWRSLERRECVKNSFTKTFYYNRFTWIDKHELSMILAWWTMTRPGNLLDRGCSFFLSIFFPTHVFFPLVLRVLPTRSTATWVTWASDCSRWQVCHCHPLPQLNRWSGMVCLAD